MRALAGRNGAGAIVNAAGAVAAVVAASLLGGCAVPDAAPCPAGRPLVSDTLYLGTAKPGGIVTREEWDRFLREVVTPRFPGGFTQWDASGQWRSADGSIVREGTHVLLVVHPPEPQAEANVRAIAAEYKSRFRQEAVLRVRSGACVSS